MKTATLHETCEIKPTGSRSVSPGPKAVYALSEPLVYDNTGAECSYIYVSTARIMGKPETYAFPCDEAGEVLSWGELSGAMKGEITHAEVLEAMGYALVEHSRFANLDFS